MEPARLSQPSYRTLEQVTACIQGLSETDFLRILAMTRIWTAGLRAYSPEDLLQEALTRILEGRRQIPEGVNFLVSVAEVIHSLSSERRKQENEFEKESTNAEEPIVNADPSDQLDNANTLLDIVSRLGTDDTAKAVLEKTALGFDAAEICSTLGIKKTTYESARKRIRRAVLARGRVS